METCSVEVGLLRKKPCGSPAVTRCTACEQALCTQHAIPQVTSMGKRTGTFLCKECEAAGKAQAKGLAEAAEREQKKKQAAVEKAAMAPPVEKKPVSYAQQAKQPAKDEKPAESAPLEFTPSKPPADGKK